MLRLSMAAMTVFCVSTLSAQTAPKITTPKDALGFNLGDDYNMASYTQLDKYWHKIASECDRCKLVDIGPTEEGRRQYMMIITSPENLKKLDHYKEISSRLAHAEGVTEPQARALAAEGKAVVWIDGGLHASETVGSQQLMETVYQLVSRTDAETMRFLKCYCGSMAFVTDTMKERLKQRRALARNPGELTYNDRRLLRSFGIASE